MLRKGKPASFRLFPVGSYVVFCGAASFLPTLFGLLKAIRWCGCHHASCAVSTPSTNALASDSLSASGPLGPIGGFALPSFGCGCGQRFSTNSRRSSVTKGEPEDLVEFFCQRSSSLSLAMPSTQLADKIECSRTARPANLKTLTIENIHQALQRSAWHDLWGISQAAASIGAPNPKNGKRGKPLPRRQASRAARPTPRRNCRGASLCGPSSNGARNPTVRINDGFL